jgi:hypothetical protein
MGVIRPFDVVGADAAVGLSQDDGVRIRHFRVADFALEQGLMFFVKVEHDRSVGPFIGAL